MSKFVSSQRNSIIILLGIITSLLLIAFLKLAQIIVLPFVLSIFLCFLLLPIIHFLHKRKIPPILSALFSLGFVFILLFFLASLLLISLKSMNEAMPTYVEKAKFLAFEVAHFAKQYDINLEPQVLLQNVDPKAAASIVGKGIGFIFSILKYSLVVFFITLFMLLEASRFKTKATKAWGKNNIFDSSTTKVGIEITRYLVFKTLISLATGVLVWLFLSAVGLDFPLIWGLLAFLLNFIPSVGSIVASFPPILLAAVQFDSPIKYALIVMVGILSIQLTIGNYLDPKIMGEHLNLSTLVIFLSMVFWGWVWGPIGMLIAVPLAVCFKVALAHNDRTRKISILMEG